MREERRGSQPLSLEYGPKDPPLSGLSFSTKCSELAKRARRYKGKRINTLFHLIDKEWLQEAWKRLRKSGAPGVSGQSAANYQENLESNLDNLLSRLRRGAYRAPPVRRVYIPKSDGSKRPLGIPEIEDRLVQRAVSMLLSCIYEQDFLPISFGFRPNKGAHDAVETVRHTVNTKEVSWVLDADIAKFFDEMDHSWMMKFLSHRIADKMILRLIAKWLKAGVMEDGKLVRASTGSPQGGVISPLLANIYLHYVLDLWTAKVVPRYLKGSIWMVRYADDVLFLFRYKHDAEKYKVGLEKRLAKFGLRLNNQKSKLCMFGRFADQTQKHRELPRETFNFLGFTFFNWKSKQGKYIVGVKTAKERLASSMARVSAYLKENRHKPLSVQSIYLNYMLTGHYNYFGVSGNIYQVSRFHNHVRKTWKRQLCKRSQRAHISVPKFLRILERYPLKLPHLPRVSSASSC